MSTGIGKIHVPTEYSFRACRNEKMKRATRNILKGMGSIMNIMPPRESTTDYSRFVPQGTPEDRMREVWERVGDSLRGAIYRYPDEEKIKETPSS